MLARFSPGKGHKKFLSAAKELLGRFPHLTFIIIITNHGENDYTEKIKRLAEDYKSFKMSFLPFQQDLPEVLAPIDIFVFSSHSKAFGIALAKAMAMRKPAVFQIRIVFLDVIIDSVISYFLEKENSINLSKKLKLLIN